MMSKERKGDREGRWGRGGEGGGGGCNRRHVDAAAELRVTGDGEKKSPRNATESRQTTTETGDKEQPTALNASPRCWST